MCVSVVEDEGLYRSTCCDIRLVHNVKNLGFPFIKLFKLNRAPDPRLSTEHLPRQPFIAITAPTNSPAPDITDTERDGTAYAALQQRRRQGRAGRTNTHSFMLFPSFEIVIKADLIKPVCIIEVLGEMLTGSRYSLVLCKRLTRSNGKCWAARGRRDRDFCAGRKPDTDCLCVPMLHGGI